MSVVKIHDKNRLNRLMAKLILRLGRKPKQQEVIDLCVQIADENFEVLVKKLSSFPILDDEKIKKIQQVSDLLIDVPWNDLESNYFDNQDDADIYLV